MNPFAQLKNDGLEAAQDRLGGFSALETDVYEATIKVAYAGQSAGGAHNVTLLADINGAEYRETIYVTNKKGENFFQNKNDVTKKVPLPGFVTIDDLCLVTTGAPLCDQLIEEKMVKVWDRDAGAEMPKSVPVLTNLIGQKVRFGILKQTVDQNEKDASGNYVPSGKTRDENIIDKVFEYDSKLTVVEARNGLESAVFHDSWASKNRGVTRDRTSKEAANQNGRTGRPGAAPGAAPQAGALPKGKSLFGK